MRSLPSSWLLAGVLIATGCTRPQAGMDFVPQNGAARDSAFARSDRAAGRALDPNGGWGLVEYPLPWKHGLTYIASDGNGNEWTGVASPPRLVALNESNGNYTDFIIPGADAAPYGIALGRNRNGMWFTQPDSNGFGYIRFSDHAFKLFTLSGKQAGLRGITAGPDNAMWFAEYQTEKIGRIDMNGFTVTEYSVAPCNPDMITAGTDGALWFTSGCGIGRITTGGKPSIYQLGGSRIAIGLTTGPDGAIWYTGITQAHGSFVGRIDLQTHVRTIYNLYSNDEGTWDIATRGRYLYMTNPFNTALPYIDRFNIDTHARARGTLPFKDYKPYGIVLGTDDQLWFTNQIIPTSNKIEIGKLCPDLTHQQCRGAQ
jgi:virginiamycin B lyase